VFSHYLNISGDTRIFNPAGLALKKSFLQITEGREHDQEYAAAGADGYR
jgi:hypothetical protein